jgi:hypothetical protein
LPERASRRRWLPALVALGLAAALGACDVHNDPMRDPSRIPPGSSREFALQRLGPPTASYQLASGERLQYSRAPAGFEVNNIDLDATGHVVAVTQVLDERLFEQTIRPGDWTEEDVERTYGKPARVSRVGSFDGGIWEWRYKQNNTQRMLYIYVDPRGVVQRYQVADEHLN